MFKELLDNVRQNTPLIHNITNYVTVNDCANALLACGASPIMADDASEAEEITAICQGLTINIGTPHASDVAAMLLAGKKANQLAHPVVLDPVGAGASDLRTNSSLQLLKEIHFSAIRGNISEIKALALGSDTTRGVDAALNDKIDAASLADAISFLQQFSARTGAVIAVTGAIDIIADEDNAFICHNGVEMMKSVTGTGCMLSCLTAAYIAANPEQPLNAAAAAVCMMGLAGETAFSRLKEGEGNATLRTGIIDAIYNMTGPKLEQGAKYEQR